MIFRVLISLMLLLSTSALAIDKIDREMVDNAVQWIDKYTKEKDFIKATKFYFEGTKFFSHEIIDGKEVITENSSQEVIPMIKEYFETSDIEVIEDNELSKKISFTLNNQIATGISESIIIMTSEGNKYQSHGIVTLVFGIKNEQMVLLESHDKNISFKQL